MNVQKLNTKKIKELSDTLVIDASSMGFTTHLNYILQNVLGHDLELIGLWCYLTSLPPNFHISKTFLRKKFSIGRHKMDDLFSTLEHLGLLHQEQKRDEKGHFLHTFCAIYSGLELLQESFKNSAKSAPVAQISSKKNTHEKSTTLKNNGLEKKPDYPLSRNRGPRKLDSNINNIYNINNINNICAAEQRDNNICVLFEQFYHTYPRKRDKTKAERAWNRLKLSDSQALEIIEDVKKRILADAQWLDIKFIPYPSSYLNAKRWLDTIEVQKAKALTADRGVVRPQLRDFTAELADDYHEVIRNPDFSPSQYIKENVKKMNKINQ